MTQPPARPIPAAHDGCTGIVVAIPTYRRPELLHTLLRSASAQIVAAGACVEIADNDCGTEVPEVVARFRAEGLPIHCVGVPDKGISQARNALLRAANLRHPNWRWLIMLDDDGTVQPGWLEALLAAARANDADIAGGPVLGALPERASILARNSVYAGRARHATGPVDMLNGAQNIVIGRSIADRIGDPWFEVSLGGCGGEDHHFFRQAKQLGARLVWCDDACVVEPTPADRLTPAALFRRAFRSSYVSAQTDRHFLGGRQVGRSVALGLRRTGRNLAAAAVRRDADRLASVTLDVAALAGRAVGGMRSRQLRARHGDLGP